jgi:hypothetical protein
MLELNVKAGFHSFKAYATGLGIIEKHDDKL